MKHSPITYFAGVVILLVAWLNIGEREQPKAPPPPVAPAHPPLVVDLDPPTDGVALMIISPKNVDGQQLRISIDHNRVEYIPHREGPFGGEDLVVELASVQANGDSIKIYWNVDPGVPETGGCWRIQKNLHTGGIVDSLILSESNLQENIDNL